MNDLPAPSAQRVVANAKVLFDCRPNWAVFYEQVFGINGIIEKAYPTPPQRHAFERTAEYGELHDLLNRLIILDPLRGEVLAVTIWVPVGVWAMLDRESGGNFVRFESLCLLRLLQPLLYFNPPTQGASDASDKRDHA